MPGIPKPSLPSRSRGIDVELCRTDPDGVRGRHVVEVVADRTSQYLKVLTILEHFHVLRGPFFEGHIIVESALASLTRRPNQDASCIKSGSKSTSLQAIRLEVGKVGRSLRRSRPG